MPRLGCMAHGTGREADLWRTTNVRENLRVGGLASVSRHPPLGLFRPLDLVTRSKSLVSLSCACLRATPPAMVAARPWQPSTRNCVIQLTRGDDASRLLLISERWWQGKGGGRTGDQPAAIMREGGRVNTNSRGIQRERVCVCVCVREGGCLAAAASHPSLPFLVGRGRIFGLGQIALQHLAVLYHVDLPG